VLFLCSYFVIPFFYNRFYFTPIYFRIVVGTSLYITGHRVCFWGAIFSHQFNRAY